MQIRNVFLSVLVMGALAIGIVLAYGPITERLETRVFENVAGFDEWPLPLKQAPRLFDIGIVDADGNGWLDVYTSNHHFRQALLLSDGKGGYREVLSEWGLDQSIFPLAELSFVAPTPEKPGVYLHWLGTDFVIRAHRLAEVGDVKGTLHVFEPVRVMKSDGVRVDEHESKEGQASVTESRIDFTASRDGVLVLRPGGQGVPLRFTFGGSVDPSSIFVGLGKVSPQSLSFSLAMQDRHGMAWADFNGDGVLDVFVTRGALSGRLRAYPQHVVDGIHDELFLSRAPGAFEQRAYESGLRKEGCSGRHARWVDFDGDGLLDLFVNCYDRGNVPGDYPKQLYRQGPRGTLRNVADQVGLALPDKQMSNLVWFDVDGDGKADLLAVEDDGIFLYYGGSGSFRRELVAQRSLEDAPTVGRASENYWLFDGKLSLADYNSDGRIDVFFASKRGNMLLRNVAGRLELVDPVSVGVPARSVTASWVDYDNDGRPDLHLVPDGIYRQRSDGRFESTGLLAVARQRYDAAIVNWADLDNDGRIDVVLALSESPEFTPWWEIKRKPRPRGRWKVIALRNVQPRGQWLQVELAGEQGNRQGIGAVVSVLSGEATASQVVGASEGTFFSQGHYRAYFGLGNRGNVERLRVQWPDGFRQTLENVAAGQLIRIERGGARAAPSAATTGVSQ
jgi:hypothetical protein